MDIFISKFVSCQKVEEENSITNKNVSLQKKEAGDKIKAAMIEQKTDIITVGDRLYFVLEEHVKRPSLTLDLFCLVLDDFLKTKNINWSESEMQEFKKIFELCMIRMQETTKTLKLTDKRPAKLFFTKKN